MAKPLSFLEAFAKGYGLSEKIRSKLQQHGYVTEAKLEVLACSGPDTKTIRSLDLSKKQTKQLYDALQMKFAYAEVKSGRHTMS